MRGAGGALRRDLQDHLPGVSFPENDVRGPSHVAGGQERLDGGLRVQLRLEVERPCGLAEEVGVADRLHEVDVRSVEPEAEVLGDSRH